VTRFSVENEYVAKFGRRVVGAARHEELWVPAEQLEEFNAHLVGHVEVIAAYFGPGFVGSLPARYGSTVKDAKGYLLALLATYRANPADLLAAVYPNHKSVFCNYAYWRQIAPMLPELHGGVRDGRTAQLAAVPRTLRRCRPRRDLRFRQRLWSG
jgi:hypothetical protein